MEKKENILLSMLGPSEETPKKTDMLPSINILSSFKKRVGKDTSDSYEIPSLEKENKNDESNNQDNLSKRNKIDFLDLNEKLSKILKMTLPPMGKDQTSVNNTKNSNVVNKNIQNYYSSESPTIITNNNSSSDESHSPTFRKEINVSNILNENISDISQGDNVINSDSRISVTNDFEDLHIENNHQEENNKNNSKKIYFSSIKRKETSNTNNTNKKINMVKVLDRSSNNYEILPGLEDGGVVTEPTKVYVGEGGPEAIIPLDEYDTSYREEMNNIYRGLGVKGKVDEYIKTEQTVLHAFMQAAGINVALKTSEALDATKVQNDGIESTPPPTIISGPESSGSAPSVSGGGGLDPLTMSLLEKVSLPPWRKELA